LVTTEKRKQKKRTKKLQQAIKNQTQGKEQDHLKKTNLYPFRQGQRLDTTETRTKIKQRAKDHQTKLEKPRRAPPAHMQAPPEPMQLPLDKCMQTTSQNKAAAPTQL
jgi:hypothetical protein